VLSFSKLKVFLIYLLFIIISFFFSFNFQDENNLYVDKKINLGLDLQGGSYLLLEVETEQLIEERLQNKVLPLKKTLRANNINYTNFIFKNKEITFNIENDKYEEFKKIIFSQNDNEVNTYLDLYRNFELETKNQNGLVSVYFSDFGILNLNNSAVKQSIEVVRRRIDDIGTREPTIIQRGDKRILVELPGIKDPNRIKSLLGKTAKLNFRFISENDDEFGVDLLPSDETSELLSVSKKIIISGDNLIEAQPRLDSRTNEPIVSFTLDRTGSQKFGKATTENVGRRLAIILDDKLISAPQIREAITTGSGVISGNFDFQSATDLALLLRSGALPTEIKVVEERSVGPDLGQDSIDAGKLSLIVGFGLVIIFMVVKYKVLGLIANISLVANLLMLLGILTIFNATLTLPGIAGIILTVGMAVDSNVLIFERIKEELKSNKSIIQSFDTGYERAKSAVIDANITTLLAAIVLFIFGTGPVKGFAVTLGVGILTTLFCAYYLARHLTSIVAFKNKDKAEYQI